MEPIVAPIKIVGMVFSALLGLALPVALAIFWRKKTHAKWSALLVGALTFFVFVYVLESSMHAYCLGAVKENAISAFLKATPWAYVLYGGLAAGVFEETGRLVAFKWLLKKQQGRETGVMYGIGHGGIEAVLVCCVSMISSIAFSLSLNSLGTEAMLAQAGDQLAAMQSSIATVTQTPPALFFVSGIERVIAVVLHIALSVLVFAAANRKGKFYLYPLAILFHAGIDCIAVFYQLGKIGSIAVIELIVGALTALVAFYAWRVYRADRPALADAEAAEPEASVSVAD